jgi:molybdate transport system substrate-binding protein
VLALLAGCGGEDGQAGRPRLTVSAAASLTGALTACSRKFDGADVRLSFGGSDELAAQIRQGVKPDVYAAANMKLPEALASEDLLEAPVEFATNELVMALPGDEREIEKVDDLTKPGTRIVMGADTVPVGSYTRQVLDRLPPATRDKILGVVKGTGEQALAQRYLDGLTKGACADALREEGFGPPPSG